MSSKWSDTTEKALGGEGKKPKKEIREVRTRKGKSGGFIHEHHHTHPDHHPMEEHTSPDDAAMVAHMMQTMGGPGAGGDTPDAGAAPAPGAAAPQPGAMATPGA